MPGASRGTDGSNPVPSSGESNELRTHPSNARAVPAARRDQRVGRRRLQQRLHVVIADLPCHTDALATERGDPAEARGLEINLERKQLLIKMRERIILKP
jgi:hypothetical protein